jgi:simple sugar transport system ATP-binding protein
MVATRETSETTPEELAELMVGRRVLLRVTKKPANRGATLLQVKDLNYIDEKGVRRFSDISFEIRAGEIVGVAGVAGNGQSELLEVLAGIRHATSGEIILHGEHIPASMRTDPKMLRKKGLAHVPEDRHRMGLVTAFEEWENAALGYHGDPNYLNGPLLDIPAIRDDAKKKIEQYDIRPPNCRLKTANFSGGNQQKIVLAREMERDPSVLLIGQPTRGVDIGAIEFIHRQLLAMREAGKAILLVSVELDEIRSLSDRILVMCDGRIVGERMGDCDEREIGLMMAGVEKAAA